MDISNYTGKRSKIVTGWNYLIKNHNFNFIGDNYSNYVYVVYSGKTRAYKIGMTGNYPERYKSLCNSVGEHLILEYLINLVPTRDGPNWLLEKYLKDYFENKKVKGEWFKLNRKYLNEIEDLFYHIFGDDIWTRSDPFLMTDHSHHGSCISSSGELKQIG